MSAKEIARILNDNRVVAVIGLSQNRKKDSHHVSAYLKSHGYKIVPVNPNADQVLGEKSYRSLSDIPDEVQKTIQIVDIFRPSADVPPIVDEAIEMRQRHGTLGVVWMQLGIVNEQAAEKARKAGITVVMDHCMMIEHRTLQLGS